MKAFLSGILCLLCCASAFGQMPKYVFTSWAGGIVPASQDFHSPSSIKIQSLYHPSNFPGVKTGVLTAIYLRVGRTYPPYTTNPTVINNFRMKIGYTTDTVFRRRSVDGHDTFATGLTLIVNRPNISIQGADSVGKWIRLPLEANFLYDSAKRFIVEVSRSYVSGTIQPWGFDFMASTRALKRSVSGYWDSGRGNANGFVMDLGLEFFPTAIYTVSPIKNLYTYPNPSTGLFTIGFERAQPSPVSLAVYSITGQCIYRKAYAAAGGSFTENVDITAAPKGIYFLKIESDGTAETRRILVE